jgi:hypothetical protein
MQQNDLVDLKVLPTSNGRSTPKEFCSFMSAKLHFTVSFAHL